MQVACGQCGASYQFDAAAIPAAGYDAQCSTCSHVFFVRPEAEAPQVVVACDHCGAAYQFAPSDIPAAGYDAQCTQCHQVFFVSLQAARPAVDDVPEVHGDDFDSMSEVVRMAELRARAGLPTESAELLTSAALPSTASADLVDAAPEDAASPSPSPSPAPLALPLELAAAAAPQPLVSEATEPAAPPAALLAAAQAEPDDGQHTDPHFDARAALAAAAEADTGVHRMPPSGAPPSGAPPAPLADETTQRVASPLAAAVAEAQVPEHVHPVEPDDGAADGFEGSTTQPLRVPPLAPAAVVAAGESQAPLVLGGFAAAAIAPGTLTPPAPEPPVRGGAPVAGAAVLPPVDLDADGDEGSIVRPRRRRRRGRRLLAAAGGAVAVAAGAALALRLLAPAQLSAALGAAHVVPPAAQALAQRAAGRLLEDTDDAYLGASRGLDEALAVDAAFGEGLALAALGHTFRGVDLQRRGAAAFALQQQADALARGLTRAVRDSAGRPQQHRDLEARLQQQLRLGRSRSAEATGLLRAGGRALAAAATALARGQRLDPPVPLLAVAAAAHAAVDPEGGAAAEAWLGRAAALRRATPTAELEPWLGLVEAGLRASEPDGDSRAERLLRQALAGQPRLQRARWLLAELRASRGDRPGARRLAAEILAAQPGHDKARALLASLALEGAPAAVAAAPAAAPAAPARSDGASHGGRRAAHGGRHHGRRR